MAQQKKHKHYQCIRAFTDGWKIEVKSLNGDWVVIEYPSFYEDEEYRVVPDAYGWLPWYATEDSVCPVDRDAVVAAKSKNRDGVSSANVFTWNTDTTEPITHYRIVREYKTPRAKRTLVKTIKVFSDGSTEEE